MKQQALYSVGIVGVRGFVGQALVKLISNHPQLKLNWVSSRQLAGQSITQLVTSPLDEHTASLSIDDYSAEQISQVATDIVILGLPNGLAAPYVEQLEKHPRVKIILDLSADFRFDADWTYSVPELSQLADTTSTKSTPIKISNPGCYATAMQLALAPLLPFIEGTPHCFGISGYSGAGSQASKLNNRENLSSNILAYQPCDHLHQKEVAFQLGIPLIFSPHVADFFSGIHITIQFALKASMTVRQLNDQLSQFYGNSEFVHWQEPQPCVAQVRNSHHCLIGGVEVSQSGNTAAISSCLDNLLKGAASQAIQNINLALAMLPSMGLNTELSNFKLSQGSLV